MRTKEDRIEAMARLQELCPAGTTVYCVVRSVSRSGMSRNIDCYVIQDNELIWITGYMSCVLSYTIRRNSQGLHVGGCGMDMCFAVVYELSRTLYSHDGYKLKHVTI